MRFLKRVLSAALLVTVLGFGSAVSAGAVTGTLRAPDGAAVPDAWLIALDRTRPVRVAVRTRDDGSFTLPLDAKVSYRLESGRGWDRVVVADSIAGTAPPGDLVLPAPAGAELRSSSFWLGKLPEGDEKRRFILDCTGCHQFNETRVFYEGKPRSEARWAEDVTRMLTYAGSTTGFPVISDYRKPGPTAAWLWAHLGTATAPPATPISTSGWAHSPATGEENAADAIITEYDLPIAGDLPHDLAVDPSGDVIVTGMMTHTLYRLDPVTGAMAAIPIPVPKANPRAIEIDRKGNWWVLLGGPRQIGRYEPSGGTWSFHPIGMYPHSIAVSADGAAAWFNGHFTRDPEQIGRLDVASGKVQTFDAPPHPTLAALPGGPIPYEQRIGPDGTVWMSELQGNRIVSFDPASQRFRTWTLPTPLSGPRRFDVDSNGVLWIPAYSANRLVRLEPRTETFTEFPLPAPDALPYIVRVHPETGQVWIGTAAADQVFRFDPGTGTFAAYPLPTRGATVRHMAIDSRTGHIWLAYGASPALHPARIARLEPR
jgi:virginiamycin B lyase